MPEGPEVRSLADYVRPTILGQKIKEFTVNKLYFRKSTGLDNIVDGQTIKAVRSYGKKFILDLGDKLSIVYSLGMTGRMSYGPTADDLIIATLVLDKVTLYYIDSRRFGRIDIIESKKIQEFFKLGPDMMGDEITEQEWANRMKEHPRKSISNALVDGKIAYGIGNYLRSEILYAARIDPKRKIKDLSDKELKTVYEKCKEVMKRSYDSKGFTIENYILPDNTIGLYQPMIFGMDKDPKGHPVEKYYANKRAQATYWVPAVQK